MPEDKSFTIENYLGLASNSLEADTNQQEPTYLDPLARTSLINPNEKEKLSDDGNVLDFFAQAAWGGISGLTWGASELDAVASVTGQQVKRFEEMNDMEKAGWVTGEGLSLFTPFIGPFAVLGRGGSFIARKTGNKFVREAAEKAIEARSKTAGFTDLSDYKKTLSDQLYSGLTSRKMAASVQKLQADHTLARAASPYLRAQTKAVIDRVLEEEGVQIAAGASRELAKDVVTKLASGRFVNDIGEIVARGLGGRDPGNVSKYVGMAAQDFLYMGLHALGMEKINTIVEDRHAHYFEHLKGTGVMALGFPLIRAIGKGGNESIQKGVQAYFSRYKKINYKDMTGTENIKLGKALLDANVNGAHINIFNRSKMRDKTFKTPSGNSYTGAGIKALLKKDGGKYFDDNPEEVVGLLNSMRTEISREYTSMWRQGYLQDLWKSIPRIGTGILFMNYAHFNEFAFGRMGEEELASHLFMAALMTKSRGAWGHHDKQGYMHDRYGDIEKSLEFLKVEKGNFEAALTNIKEQELIGELGLQVYANPAAEKIVQSVDSVINKNKDWYNRTGINNDKIRYAKVRTLLSAYNTIKVTQDRNFKPLSIDELTPEALKSIEFNMGEIYLGGKKIKDTSEADISRKLNNEFAESVKQDYIDLYLTPLAEQLGFPMAIVNNKIKVAPLEMDVPTNRSYENTAKFIEFINKNASILGIDVERVDAVPMSKLVSDWAAKNGVETNRLEKFDAAVGEIGNSLERSMSSRYRNHNIHLNVSDNIFLKSIKVIQGIEAKDDLFKLVTGVKTDNIEIAALHRKIMDVFGRDGRLLKDISLYNIKDVDKADVPVPVTEALLEISPILNLTRTHKTGATDSVGAPIPKSEIISIAKQVAQLKSRLPEAWRSQAEGSPGLESIATDVFMRRILSGGNPMAMSALRELQDARMIESTVTDGGIMKIILPEASAIEAHYGRDRATAQAINKAIDTVAGVFNPNIVERSSHLLIGDKIGEINPRKFIDIAKNLSDHRVDHFIREAADVIGNLDFASKYEKQLVEISESLKSVDESFAGKDLPANYLALQEMNKKIRDIHTSLVSENLIGKSTADKLNELITKSENFVNDMPVTGSREWQYNIRDGFHDVSSSINKFIKDQLTSEFGLKDKLSVLTLKLSNAYSRTDPNLSPAEVRKHIETLTSRIGEVARQEAYSPKSLAELVLELNESRNWRDIEPTVNAIMKSLQTANIANNSLYDITAVRSLKTLHGERLAPKSSLSAGQIILKHDKLHTTENPNNLNPAFKLAMDSAFIGQREYKDVFREFVYTPLIKSGAASGRTTAEIQKDINDFNNYEAARLIQDMYGGSQRWTFTLSQNKLLQREKPLRDNLSLRSLDREEAADNLGGYTFAILEGKGDINGRRESFDDSRLFQGRVNWIQRVLDKTLKLDADKYDSFWERMRYSEYEFSDADLPRTNSQIFPADSRTPYVRLSPKLRILFPSTEKNIERLKTDFDLTYHDKLNQYNQIGTDQGAIKARNLKRGFEHLTSAKNQDPYDPNNIRTKLMFIQMNKVLGPEFDGMMSGMESRQNFEYNMYKRLAISDGGTSTNITREALKFLREYHPNQEVSDMARELIDKKNHKITIDVINDEGDNGFFSNLVNVKEKLARSGRKSSGIERDLKELFNKEINKEEFPSLDSYFLDGNKFASKKFAQLLWALSGKVGDFNGAKTTIMDGRLLGKGFLIYHPDIASVMKGDILVGSTVAKTLGGNSVSGKKIKMYEPDVDPNFPLNLRTGWEKSLRGLNQDNQLEIPVESIGIGFTADKKTGVSLSNSMVDMQNRTHVENAVQMYQLRQVISHIKDIETSKEYSNGELIKFLQRIKNEDYAHTSPTNSLMELLAEVGVTEANPLIRKQLDRMLQSEYFEAITHRPFKHGEETIIMADIPNRLSLPTYVQFDSGTNSSRRAMQYGGGTITNSMSRVRLGADGIKDIPFIARDPITGIDFSFTVNKIGKDGKVKTEDISVHSPMEQLLLDNMFPTEGFTGTGGWSIKNGDITSLYNLTPKATADLASGKLTKSEIGPEHLVKDNPIRGHRGFKDNVKSVIQNISEVTHKSKNPTHGDVWHLIHIDGDRKGFLPKGKRIDFTGDPIGLKKDNRSLSRDYKMTTGMIVNSIPKVLKDQPFIRVEEILDRSMNGLSSINNYDIRVTLQRDFDGDHLYKYLKMPSQMSKDYANDMGDIKDYKMFSEKQMRHAVDKMEFNMFGFDDNGVAGMNGSTVGFDRIANHVSHMKKSLSTVIGIKGTISHLANSGLTYEGRPLIDNSIHNKGTGIDRNNLGLWQRSGELFQNSLDIWKGQHEITESRANLENYFLYGEAPSNINRPDVNHVHKSWFDKADYGTGGAWRNIEREAFNIMHYTLKSTKDMYNNVWDESGQRQPHPRELRNSYDNIQSLFSNPDSYIFRAIMRKISYMNRSNDMAVRERADVLKKEAISFFFRDVANVYRGGKAKEAVEALLKEGNWKEAVSYIGRLEEGSRNLVPIFSMDYQQGAGINGSVGGFALKRSVTEPVFYEKNFNLSKEDNQTIHNALSGIEKSIESMLSYGDLSFKDIRDMSNKDFKDTFPINEFSDGGVVKANMKGILRATANNQYKRELDVLRYLENEAFPDANKIERSQNKLFSIKKVIDVLDRDMIHDNFIDKSKNQLDFIKAKTDREKGKFKRQFFMNGGTLYRIKGDVSVDKFKPSELDFSKVKYFTHVEPSKNGRYITIERGWTYILDKKPIQFKSMADEAPAWQRAFAKSTMVGEIDAYSILMKSGINPDNNPFVYDKLMTDVKQLRQDIRGSFSDAMSEVTKSKFNYVDNFQYSEIQTNRAIDKFFADWVGEGKHLGSSAIPDLIRFLIQPTMQQNVFYKDGTRETPYYQMNPRLVQSIFKWMRFPGLEGDGANLATKSNEQIYRFDSKGIIKDIISDQNAFKTGNFDHISRSINKTRSMRTNQYKIEWEHYQKTTTDEITRDWFYHPVLSRTLTEMYADPGSIFKKSDRMYVDYGKQIKRQEKSSEYGCEK